MKTSASQLVDRCVRRMAIDLDFQLTLTASGLCQLLAVRVGFGKRNAKSRMLFRNFVKTPTDITIVNDSVDVRIGRRENNPFLLTAACDEADIAVPWLGNRRLRIGFPRAEAARIRGSHQLWPLGIEALDQDPVAPESEIF